MIERTPHGVEKYSGYDYDPRSNSQPTRDSIAAALAAQRREREAFAKLTGSRVNRDGRMRVVARHHE